MVLKFNPLRHGQINDFIANGFGKNKKTARSTATERLVVDLIQTGLIKLGLRDKKYLRQYKEISYVESSECK